MKCCCAFEFWVFFILFLFFHSRPNELRCVFDGSLFTNRHISTEEVNFNNNKNKKTKTKRCELRVACFYFYFVLQKVPGDSSNDGMNVREKMTAKTIRAGNSKKELNEYQRRWQSLDFCCCKQPNKKNKKGEGNKKYKCVTVKNFFFFFKKFILFIIIFFKGGNRRVERVRLKIKKSLFVLSARMFLTVEDRFVAQTIIFF